MLAILTIIGVLSTNVVLQAKTPSQVVLSTVMVTNLVSASGTNYIVSNDRVLIVNSNAVVRNGYQLSTSVPAEYLISNTNVSIISGNSAVYVGNGSAFLLAQTSDGVFTAPLIFYQNMPGTISNFYAFNAGTLGSNLNLTISNHYGGKSVTIPDLNGTWNLFQDYTALIINTNCWDYGVDFSCFISRDMSGSGPITLITSRHGISCMHAWDWTPGREVFAVDANGVRYTNWIQSSAGMGDDCRLVTLSNNFPNQINPAWILPSNWNSKISIPDWSVCWYRANSRHLATARTVTANLNVPGVTSDYIQANLNIPGSAFNETVASGGDSGGPVWLMLSNHLVFVGALYSYNVAVPFVSNPRYYTNILSAIGTNTLNTVDVSGYF